MGSFNKKNKSPGGKRGGHWVICDRTGMAIREQDAREEWTGSVVAKEEREPRHPQDYYRAREDDQSPKGLVRTEATDKENEPYFDWGYIENGYFGLE
jgi:hypothetical protein